ncbi:hypothetical protein CC80DRAFT_598904 [Byssothecium circinans]|uniref:Uncharacterized protein n=1 Tax=Byssothecium circinans TaxID=147558 RepID=A0A6A5TCJ8_9PLEO|nr:hypothetical protein CC80DRAFT_598904 [Byssothecium circinans]
MADVALRLAEDIALLQRICNKPIKPTTNKYNGQVPTNDRALTFKQEADIVNCLCYLSSYSDNPDHVMAMCVEEALDHRGLTVTLATNTGSVSHLQQGVESICTVLERQCVHPENDYCNDLLNEVIKHGRARITKRLGLSSSEPPKTAARLKLAFDLTLKLPKSKRPPLSSEVIQLGADFSRLSKRYNETPMTKRNDGSADVTLLSIMIVATEIWRTHQTSLEALFDRIPNSEMDPTTKESTICQLEKLAHYVPTAKSLLRKAGSLPVFQSVKVQSVYFSPADMRTGLHHSATKLMGLLVSSVYKGRKGLQENIKKQVTENNANQSYKVHAEIQLLFHYELFTVKYPPRVLKSSKHACFLCDLFIKKHGRFHIPKTHGRVYELWMIPELAGLNMKTKAQQQWSSTIQVFNTAVEEWISKLAAAKKAKLTDPRESGIFSLLSTSSQRSCHEASVWDEHVTETEVREERDVLERDTLASPITATTPVVLGPPQAVDREDKLSNAPVLHVEPGSQQSFVFEGGNLSVRFHTTKIHIEVLQEQAEMLASGTSTSHLQRQILNIRVTAHWLDAEEAFLLSDDHQEALADLDETLSTMEAKEGVLFGISGLLIRKGEQTVQLKAMYEKPAQCCMGSEFAF